ncbi:Zinc finger, GATA-type [Dillenia turbinata]|uniref:Zinc finger, GATA-type n=1 Tax=Dillenia turbinata TaxID=194707 RepID=A0AAN8VW60_9MAGN
MMGVDEKRLVPEVTNTVSTTQKRCVDCHTTSTPLWRGGPAGPRSLCNACGIRYRKKRRALLGISKAEAKKNKQKMKITSGSNGNTKSSNLGMEGSSLKMRLMALGRDLLQRPLAEEEQAAILLMALSCS